MELFRPLMSKKIDLHIHTNYSDGTYTPEDVVRVSKDAGLSAIAITDHDTTEGIVPALKHAAKVGIEVIPGIELSCEYNEVEIHILGYYINWENNWFQEKLKVFQKARERRAFHILNKLRNVGVDIDEQMLFSQASVGAISRVHFARCLVEMGEAETMADAFQKYLVEGRPAFVKKLRILPEEALSMINRVGGVAVLAHPIFGGGHKLFMKRLKRLGLAGVEVYHPSHNTQLSEKYLNMSSELGLIATGGTDSHGGKEEENPIGSIEVDYELVDGLKNAKNHSEIKNRIILIH
ncbi:MAG: PHP domain-containing protein [Elusimicrobia bacterium]|nr:PHP domain-containing protein [Elusimicrobiota bacterium]